MGTETRHQTPVDAIFAEDAEEERILDRRYLAQQVGVRITTDRPQYICLDINGTKIEVVTL
jgi:hypothetical protein